MKKKPKTLFLNVSENEAKQVKHFNELDAEFGFFNTAGSYNHHFPSAPYDYDIVIAVLDNEEAEKLKEKFATIADTVSDGEYFKHHLPRGFLLGFMGNCDGSGIRLLGIEEETGLEVAEKRDREFHKANHSVSPSPFDVIAKRVKPILPVQRFIGGRIGIWRCLLANRNGKCIAAYKTRKFSLETGSEHKPNGLLLPVCEKRAEVIGQVLDVLMEERSDLFPSVQSGQWLSGEEFTPAEVREVDKKIAQKVGEMEKWKAKQDEKKKEIENRYYPYKQILVADDDLDESAKLSVNVKTVLEELGFQVRDIDEALKDVKGFRKEDFWVTDKDYFALCEVTGTNSKNIRQNLYSRILGRITTAIRRKPGSISLEGVKDVKDVSGLLIVNHDKNSHPKLRPRLYTGEDEEIADAAKELGISILSTAELYKIAMDVKEGRLSPAQSRKIIKGGGRIEYNKRKYE